MLISDLHNNNKYLASKMRVDGVGVGGCYL